MDVGWSKLSDLNVHEGKLLGCSYNQSCVGVWVVDLVKETKSLERLSDFQNSDHGKEFSKESKVLPSKLFFESFNSWFSVGFGYCIFLFTLFFKKIGLK